jgi:hypothetical protein
MDVGTASQMMLAATQSLGIFTAMLPSRTELYKSAPDTTTKQNVRQGEMLAATLALSFAGVLSYLSKDSTPLLIAAASTVTLIAAYELTMHMNPTGELS